MPETNRSPGELELALELLLRRSGDFARQSLESSSVTFARCNGGYSHDNFHVQCNLGEFALRVRRTPVPKPWFELAFLQDWAQPLVPPLIAWDEASGNLLTRWCSWPSQHRNAPPLKHCLELLSSLSALSAPVGECPTYPLRSQISDWLANARDVRGLALLAGTPDLPGPHVLCHNDLNGDNLLYRDGSWQVLDWEWAGLNNALFDAATLAADLPEGSATLEQLTPTAAAEERALAWRWFCLREYAFAMNALLGPDPATRTVLTAQRDRYAAELALSLT